MLLKKDLQLKKERKNKEKQCKFGAKSCFYKYNQNKKEENEEKEIDICPESPCLINLYDFGTHKRIIRYYIQEHFFEEALYYMENLIPQFPIECNLDKLDEYKSKTTKKELEEDDKRSMPIGCRLFYEQTCAEKILDVILLRQKSFSNNTMEEEEKASHRDYINTFKDILFDNLTRLEHLAISKREELRDKKLEREYNIQLTKAQMGDLETKSLQTPINKDVEDALRSGTSKDKDKKKTIKKEVSGVK